MHFGSGGHAMKLDLLCEVQPKAGPFGEGAGV